MASIMLKGKLSRVTETYIMYILQKAVTWSRILL